jgi:hypothetical protein
MHDMVIQRGIRTQSDLEQIGKRKASVTKNSKEFTADRFYFIGAAQVQESFGVELQGISNQPLYVFENTKTGDAIGVYGDENLKDAEVIINPGASVADVIGAWIEVVGRDDFNYVTSYEEGDAFVFELIQAAKDENSGDFELEFEKPAAILSNHELQSEETLSEHIGKVGFWVQSRAGLDINFDEKLRKLTIGSDTYKDIGAAVNEILMANSETQCVALIEKSANLQFWGSNSEESESGKKALRAVMEVSIKTSFPEIVDVTEGSFYIAAIECDEVSLVSNQIDSSTISLDSDKPVILGEFWESNLSYDYSVSNAEGSIDVRVSGSFAFELSDYSALDGYDIDDGPIVELVMAWAKSGDDIKIIGITKNLDGRLSECEEDDNFVDL